MLDAGSAESVIGNHEYNALIWHTSDGAGGWLRSHSQVHLNQHRVTLEQYDIDPDSLEGNRGVLDDGAPRTRGARRLRDELRWFRKLPLYLETDGIRVVHAAWEKRAVEVLAGNPRALRDDRFLYRSAYGRYRESAATEVLLKGIEVPLPGGASYRDKDGALRYKTRIRWWIDPSSSPATMAEIAMPPANEELGYLAAGPEAVAALPGYTDTSPVFVGHYWFTGTPAPVAPRVACLDYSIAREGILCAYRYEGSPLLTRDNFAAVDPAGRVVV